ncbi:MAG: GNAT family N-acetyltransferase [Acidimicrobiales bacterium]|nr:MAG: GNAT family N-acetyltransferase [Acidimicrobiales bacterium]
MIDKNSEVLNDFSAIFPEFTNSIAVSARTPMHHHIWIQAAAETLYPDHEAQIIKFGHGPDAALGAFACQKGFPGRYFLMGAEELGEQADTIFGAKESAEALAKVFKNAGRAGRFGHFSARSAFIDALEKTFVKGGYMATTPVQGAPYIDLDEKWAEPLSKLSSRYRSDFRRMGRKAEALGKVTTEILAPTPETIDKVLAEAIDVETRGWKGRAGTSLLEDKRKAAFYKRYAILASEAGILRIAFLRINDKAVATQIAVQSDGGFWLLKIGYDEEYRKCSPGNLLMLETIKYAVNEGLDRYEFLGKAAGWTKTWTQTEHPAIRLRVYPYTLHGLTALLVDGTEIALKRLNEKIQNRKKSSA